LWIQNTYAVFDVTLEDMEVFAQLDEVQRIWLNGIIDPELEEPLTNQKSVNISNEAAAWNIEYIKAPALWKKGFEGKGVVLGNADTGAQFNHESLISSYRGNKGNNVFDHNFNWFDAAGASKVPVDTHGHGTHTLSTIVGGHPGKQVGVAPKAKWIHCKAFGTSGSPSNFVKCLQFFLAPHDLNGRNANPDLRPDITSHSYVCRGCGLLPGIKALRAAGSLFVKSCGNSGPRCGSITEPGQYAEVICAGALATRSETIASFSSRGPMPGIIKPDFATPGQNVDGAVPGTSNNRYSAMSGTSMAAPALNGAFGLIWSAVPKLRGKIDKTIEIFKKSSRQRLTNDCSSNNKSPNNVYGAGIIDLEKAYELAKNSV
jgi:subtilisin family serine protease